MLEWTILFLNVRMGESFYIEEKSFLSPPFPRLTHLHTNGKFWAKLYIPSMYYKIKHSNESCTPSPRVTRFPLTRISTYADFIQYSKGQ